MDEKAKYLIKLIVVGPSGVGKSSLLLRYALDSFEDETRTTIGVDFKHKSLTVDNELVSCQIWDTAGQERFSCISKEYYRGANGCLIVFDITEQNSFTKIDLWYKELLQHSHTAEPPLAILIGNKADLKHQAQVQTADAMKYAKMNHMGYFETSAKENINVDNAFKTLITDIVREMKKNPKPGLATSATSTHVGKSETLKLEEREHKEEVKPTESSNCC